MSDTPNFYCMYHSGCIPSQSVKANHEAYKKAMASMGIKVDDFPLMCDTQCRECKPKTQAALEKKQEEGR